MANIAQIQRGFVQFVDREVAAAFDGWQRAIVGGTAGLLASNFPNLVKVYGAHPFVSALGVYDATSGNVDVDKLYDAFVPKMGTDKIPLNIPKLGTIRLGQEELALLVSYIKEA